MGKAIKCHVDIRKLRTKLHRLGKEKVPNAQIRALNRAMDRVQTQLIREAAAASGLPQKFIREKKKIRRNPKNAASTSRYKSTVFFSYHRVPVGYLGKITQTKAGARIRGRMYYRKFKATMESGHTGVFERTGKFKLINTTGRENYRPGKIRGRELKNGEIYRRMKNQRKVELIREVLQPLLGMLPKLALDTLEKVGYPEYKKRIDHEIEQVKKWFEGKQA